jgi:hypothetical protein
MKKENRNAFELLAIINRTMRKRGASKEDIKAVLDDMQSGDYEHLVEVYNKNK